MADKIYCGNAKTIPTTFGEILNISFGPNDLDTLLANKNEKGWVNVSVIQRKEVGKHGDTHFLSINNWKPEQEEVKKEEKPRSKFDSGLTIDDIPF